MQHYTCVYKKLDKEKIKKIRKQTTRVHLALISYIFSEIFRISRPSTFLAADFSSVTLKLFEFLSERESSRRVLYSVIIRRVNKFKVTLELTSI
jgi:hypothetical protein